MIAFAGGTLDRGVELIIRAVGLAERLRDADLCLTAEARSTPRPPSARPPSASCAWRLDRLSDFALAGTIGPGAEAVLEGGNLGLFQHLSRTDPLRNRRPERRFPLGERRRASRARLRRGDRHNRRDTIMNIKKRGEFELIDWIRRRASTNEEILSGSATIAR